MKIINFGRTGVVVFTGLLLVLPVVGWAKPVPQICYDGLAYLNSKNNAEAVKALTKCLKFRSLNKVNRAVSYHNRGAAYLNLAITLLYASDSNKTIEARAEKLLELALKDAEKAIKKYPKDEYGNGYGNAYCLRGKILLELSWGWDGDEDLEKGRNMGAGEKFC